MINGSNRDCGGRDTGIGRAVIEHVASFNEAVRTGDWDRFAARFAVDARMTFVGVPLGPFAGGGRSRRRTPPTRRQPR